MTTPHYDDLSGLDYASMTVGQKIKATLELTKRHGVSIFVTLLVGWLALGLLFFIGVSIFGGIPMFMSIASGNASAGFPIGAILGIVLIYFLTIFVSYFFMIGLDSLVLKYIDGLEPEGGIVAQVMSPWRNFVPILLCLLVWFGISMVYVFILMILTLIPILGTLIYMAGVIILTLVMICLYFYLAEKDSPSIGDAIRIPINLVKDNFLRWLGAFGVTILAYLPGSILLGIVMAVAGNVKILVLLCFLLFFVYIIAVSIFAFIYWGMTYRQTYGGSLRPLVDQVF